MRKVEKKWGHELIWAETDDYVGKLLHINAGHRLSLQYHEIKEETVYVLSGTLYIYDGKGGITKLSPGQSFHVIPLQVHLWTKPQGHDGDLVLFATVAR